MSDPIARRGGSTDDRDGHDPTSTVPDTVESETSTVPVEHATGEQQARENAETDPPA
jgi:hypothetical protein